jgi:hypothetical protein
MTLQQVMYKDQADAFDMWALVTAAKELAMGKFLYDPSDMDIVLAAAELDGDVAVDLSKLQPHQFRAVVAAYDANV